MIRNSFEKVKPFLESHTCIYDDVDIPNEITNFDQAPEALGYLIEDSIENAMSVPQDHVHDYHPHIEADMDDLLAGIREAEQRLPSTSDNGHRLSLPPNVAFVGINVTKVLKPADTGENSTPFLIAKAFEKNGLKNKRCGK